MACDAVTGQTGESLHEINRVRIRLATLEGQIRQAVR